MDIDKQLKELNITWYRMGKDLNIPMRTVYRWKNGGGIHNLYKEKVVDYLTKKKILEKKV